MSIITAERLVKLAYKYPSIRNNGYVFASTALTVVNQPQEIGKVLHFALRQQLLQTNAPPNESFFDDKFLLKLAEDSIASAARYMEISDNGMNLPDILVPFTYHDKLPVPFKFTQSQEIRVAQDFVASRIREAILKNSPISGLPKSINALIALKSITPHRLRATSIARRQGMVIAGQIGSSALAQEDVAGACFKESAIPTFDTIDGPVSVKSIDDTYILKSTVRGSDLWSLIYGNIKNRVRTQLHEAYPDLWLFVYHCVYGNVLSYTDILDAKETSLSIISALIPQDVNSILKGHLKGALNVGATKEEIESVQSITFDICDGSGNVSWRGGIKAWLSCKLRLFIIIFIGIYEYLHFCRKHPIKAQKSHPKGR